MFIQLINKDGSPLHISLIHLLAFRPVKSVASEGAQTELQMSNSLLFYVREAPEIVAGLVKKSVE